MLQQQLQHTNVEELGAKVLGEQPLFILDVRNENEYANWKIEGKRVESLNIPYYQLLDGVESIRGSLAGHEEIVVVCSEEGASRFVGQLLAEQGIAHVSCLLGGMKAWSELLLPVKAGDLSGGGSIYQFVRPGKGCLSYMIVSNGEAAVVDASRMTHVYQQFAASLDVTIKHAIDTHLHADHISGGRKLAESVRADYWISPQDAVEAVFPYRPLAADAELLVGSSRISVQPFYSPGHTIGSTSLVVDERFLLCGDALFIQSIGRPDLAGKADEWVHDLYDTLYERFKKLPIDLIVLPAHFSHISDLDETGKVSSRLGNLYETIPVLNLESREQFSRIVTSKLPPQPNAYQEIRQTNMGKLTPNDEEMREMENGPNRCAVNA